MKDTEKLVLDLVMNFNFSGLTHDKIVERDVFLSFVVMCFINYIEQNHYRPALKSLLNADTTNDFTQILSKEIEYKSSSHQEHFFEFSKESVALDNDEKIQRMIIANEDLLDLSKFDGATINDLVDVYDHVLQRLQFMNVSDRLDTNFNYQEPPFDFSELITLLANREGIHKAYDPYATIGESSVSYVLHNKNAEITTESVFQTAKYIKHKLLIAGASKIDSKHSFSLAPTANVEAQSFDVAYTLFQPTETSEVTEYEKLKKYDKQFLDNRIDSDTIFDKYRDHGFIQHILWSLKEDGIGFVILGKGALHRQFESNARKLLLENNYVDAVIQLPSKLMTSRTVPLSVIVLRKDKGLNKKIKFIDASSFCDFDGKCNQLIGIEDIADMYHSANSNSNNVSIVDIDDIDKNAALLTVSTYVTSINEDYEEIDVNFIRNELAEQQKYTDHLIKELSAFLDN